LGRFPDWQVVCEASDGLAAIEKAQELKPDLILLDIGLPKLNGIETARQIRKLAPNSTILLSANDDLEIAGKALDVGGSGYVVKSHAESDLLRAVQAAIQGKRFVSSSLREGVSVGPRLTD
jgi:DNA-binding NarL/FixJ family response regulator